MCVEDRLVHLRRPSIAPRKEIDLHRGANDCLWISDALLKPQFCMIGQKVRGMLTAYIFATGVNRHCHHFVTQIIIDPKAYHTGWSSKIVVSSD